MNLLQCLETLIAERSICRDTQNQYRKAARCFGEFLGAPATLADLEEMVVNRWLLSLEQTKSPETVRLRKAGITAVWNWAAGCGLHRHYNPNRLRKIKLRKRAPVAWSVDDVRLLLCAAELVPGSLAIGVPASELLTAWIWIGYEAGIRPGDILRLEPAQVGETITIVQHKTGRPHSFRLSPPALAAVQRLGSHGREKLFGLPKSTARRWELRLFEIAETIGFKRRRGQGLGTLRKAHGTEVARRGGLEAAAQSLGHISGTRIARDHYVQPDAIHMPPLPPSLLNDDAETATNSRPRECA
ncbi:tyrosine-type recombinase/integrase [Aureliella helgolandensis]|uniref:tyrosine-type recombinase/integrase n=1 Tax=Aureliella helgolandensis TaxID=2527968 RepID=UPI0011A79333|nr:hypothetical protein [Aureliella helgolandensis]